MAGILFLNIKICQVISHTVDELIKICCPMQPALLHPQLQIVFFQQNTDTEEESTDTQCSSAPFTSVRFKSVPAPVTLALRSQDLRKDCLLRHSTLT